MVTWFYITLLRLAIAIGAIVLLTLFFLKSIVNTLPRIKKALHSLADSIRCFEFLERRTILIELVAPSIIMFVLSIICIAMTGWWAISLIPLSLYAWFLGHEIYDSRLEFRQDLNLLFQAGMPSILMRR